MVPFTWPLVEEDDVAAVEAALRERHLVGDGVIGKRVEGKMKEAFGVKHVLLTPSATHALELAMLVLDIGPGDEVIVPSFSFVSAANCVVLRGATPVFAEIRPDTLNLDADDVRRRITSRTAAIIPVHYAGIGADMDGLNALGQEHEVAIVEDAAQAVDATYQEAFLGTVGDVGCYSFHATKNLTCGEGGAFLTNDDRLAGRAEIAREKGTDRSAFLRGEVDKYSWRAPGSSYLLADLQAALLESQFDKRAAIKARRKAIWERYFEVLGPLAEQGLIQLPTVPPECGPNYHIFYFLARDTKERGQILSELRQGGIQATFHFVPLHSSPFGQTFHDVENDPLPITERASATLVRLPLYAEMSEAQVDGVVEATVRALEGLG
jgi:dTDP-4-amino-4,6-dideoxygalactose transaminase